eukprot:TRINITY_DN166_c0_g1_i1.p2 TRINITY_DN166_c0_g1~~TRINITY_DN166_c0_g1_i1.p2  ORF type:complete len:179 (-),score=104.29 TRINITY_DN166_c0_g1_i1:97-633(-)
MADKQEQEPIVEDASKPGIDKKHAAIGAGVGVLLAGAAAAGGAYAYKKGKDTKKQQESPTRLFINVIKATNVLAKDRGNTSDPYVELDVGDITIKTAVIKKTLNPTWNQQFEVGVIRGETDKVEVEVKDKDILGDDSLGRCSFDIKDFGPKPTEKVFNLIGGGSGNQGKLHLSIWIQE